MSLIKTSLRFRLVMLCCQRFEIRGGIGRVSCVLIDNKRTDCVIMVTGLIKYCDVLCES